MNKPVRSKLEVAVVSEKGLRDENQDWLSWTQTPHGELFIVADGMGGHKGGARAAKMTVDGVAQHLGAAPLETPFPTALQEAITRTNADVFREAHSGNPETDHMGSTVVVALVADNRVQVGHIGDSRAYLYRARKLQLLTRDHTKVQEMLDAGMLTPEQARTHPDSHVLSRAVGNRADVKLDISEPIQLRTGDGLLLCSDGLSGYVGDGEIAKAIDKQRDVQKVPAALVNLALASGGADNVTVQYIRLGKTARERVTAQLPVPADLTVPADKAPRRVGMLALAFVAIATVAFAATGAALALLAPGIEITLQWRNTAAGQRSLEWVATGADSLTIDPPIGTPPKAKVTLKGSQVVPTSAGAPKEYTATATGKLLGVFPTSKVVKITMSPATAAAPPKTTAAKPTPTPDPPAAAKPTPPAPAPPPDAPKIAKPPAKPPAPRRPAAAPRSRTSQPAGAAKPPAPSPGAGEQEKKADGAGKEPTPQGDNPAPASPVDKGAGTPVVEGQAPGDGAKP